MTIWFDMDGTIANLYAVDNWLAMLRDFDPTPYEQAEPMQDMKYLAWLLKRVQKQGYKLGIISWCSKVSNPVYDEQVARAKKAWLSKYLHGIQWDEINIVEYGRNKWQVCRQGILFDDEEQNRKSWRNGVAFDPKDMIKVLESLA